MYDDAGWAVSIRVSGHDFERLCDNMGEVPKALHLDPDSPHYWPDRFTGDDAGTAVDPGRWKYVYWVGDNYASVIVARSFLAAIGEPFQVASDEAVEEATEAHGVTHHTHGPGWVIFTDYASPVMRRDAKPVGEAS
jgi:hypothetical protein